jgi:hypothetical protein
MGHTLLGELKRTRRYEQVVALLAGGADAQQVAQAVIQMAERHFNLAANDKAVVETVFLLMQLPVAARSSDFEKSLRQHGIEVSAAPTADQLITAVTQAIDQKLADNRGRSDLGEIAQKAAAEAMNRHLREHLGLLFDNARPEDVRGALKATHTPKNFGGFARVFIGTIATHVLNYFLGPAMTDNTGAGARFPTLAAARTYRQALSTHCFEAAKIVESFSGDWYSQVKRPEKGLTREEVGKYVYGAFQKLNAELRQGL